MTDPRQGKAASTGRWLLAIIVVAFVVPFAYKALTGPARPSLPDVRVIGLTGTVALADAHSLSWHPVAGATRYDVEIMNDQMQEVLGRSIHDTVLPLSSGTLQPGKDYVWTLRAFLPDTQVTAAPQRFRVTP